MHVFENRTELQSYLSGLPAGTIGFVPTMGALHAGHLALVERARRENGTVVASVFVNPTQFDDPGDLERYPRTPEADLKLLERAGADAVFVPAVAEMYPEPDTRVFDFGPLTEGMEGATRPGHFNGVAQVVSRLFEIVRPARAYFGEKDFQQVAVVRAMARQLALPVEIVACPTVRDADGLALSSRNALLDRDHRAAAPLIYKTLREAVSLQDRMTPGEIEERVVAQIDNNPYLATVYFRIVHADTLLPVTAWSEPGPKRGCIAVQAGDVRLIDNIAFEK